jgi:hypothetical protein
MFMYLYVAVPRDKWVEINRACRNEKYTQNVSQTTCREEITWEETYR